jgi:CRISPR-associated protein Cas2
MDSFRFMRLILFFDLPVIKEKQRREYTHFVKGLKKQGFYMLQESVYVKLNMDQRAANSSISQVKEILPKEGMVAILIITEKQFAGIRFLLGEADSDVVSSEERLVVL